MTRLVEQGKVRFLGLRLERIRRAHADHPLAAVQMGFLLLYCEEATGTRELTRDLGIAFAAYPRSAKASWPA
jgi:aryl-alcohol dehydrogenase-like predicted oxidoreductase